jgi:hypothetical protein
MDASNDGRKTVMLGGRLVELAPLTPRMTNEAVETARRRAIVEFYRTAKEAGLPFDLVNAQLNRFNSIQRVDDIVTSEALATLVFLRGRAGGMTADEAAAIPQRELLAARAAIMDEDEGPDLEGALRALGLVPEAVLGEVPEEAGRITGAAVRELAEKKISGGGGAATGAGDAAE